MNSTFINPIYIFLDTGYVEKINLSWFKKHEHIVCVINSKKEIIYSNTCTKEELDFIKTIQEDNITELRGLIVVSNAALPYYSTLIGIVNRLANLRYCDNLNMAACQDFKIFRTSKDEIILFLSFQTRERDE